MNTDSFTGKWFLVLGEPMQVVDEALSARGHHYVWLRGPRHVYARQRPEIQEASALVTPATSEQVRKSATKYSEMLRADIGLLAGWEGAA